MRMRAPLASLFSRLPRRGPAIASLRLRGGGSKRNEHEQAPPYSRETLRLGNRRFVHCREDCGEPLFRSDAHLRMRKDVELVLADRGQDSLRDNGRVEPGLHKFSYHTRRPRRVWWPGRPVALRPIACALADAGANPAGAEHAYADAERLEVHR